MKRFWPIIHRKSLDSVTVAMQMQAGSVFHYKFVESQILLRFSLVWPHFIDNWRNALVTPLELCEMSFIFLTSLIWLYCISI